MEIRNYVEYECDLPVVRHLPVIRSLVRTFAFMDDKDLSAKSMCSEAHLTDAWLSPDTEFVVFFCWVLAWNVPRFRQHMREVLAHASCSYVERCEGMGFFYE